MGWLSARLPASLAADVAEVLAEADCTPTRVARTAARLAAVEAPLVTDLLAEARCSRNQVLLLAASDPGLWRMGDQGPPAWTGLCDAARLAEATGLCVADAFPARDLAQGGLGGPVTAIPAWILLKSKTVGRALLDLGPTLHLTWVPKHTRPASAPRVLSFDVGPGMKLLDLLAAELTEGEQSFDPGGRLAVQGRQIPELLEHWLADPYFQRQIPRWHPLGVPPERYLTDAMRLAVEHGWSIRDVLCTATHFLAESAARAVAQHVPEAREPLEIVLTGGGQHNGLLLAELGARMREARIVRLSELGIAPEAWPAASAAILALLIVDQLPGNPTSVTGSPLPRVLGRLTPGSGQAWHRLLQAIMEGRQSAGSVGRVA